MSSIRDEISELGPWFHNIHLPDGTQTVPDHELGDFPAYKWIEIESAIPLDLRGWEVLDIGCNAGFYSIELAKRGGIITAIDIDPQYLAQGKWVINKFGLQTKINLKCMQVYDLARSGNSWDLVWFMGVFYHLRYPFFALDIVSRICRNLMVFQTMTLPATGQYDNVKNFSLFDRDVMNQAGWPKMAFVENCIADDPTNWWVPTHTAIVAMLRATGFKVLSRPSDEVYVCQKERCFMDVDDLREKEYRAAIGYKEL